MIHLNGSEIWFCDACVRAGITKSHSDDVGKNTVMMASHALLSGFSRFFHSSREIFLQHAATLLRVAAYPRNEFMIRDWLGDPVSTNVDVVTFHEPSVAMATMLIGTCLRDSPGDVLRDVSLLRALGDCIGSNTTPYMADWITPTRLLSRNVSLRSCALRVLNWMLECVAVSDSAFLSETWSALRLVENSTTKNEDSDEEEIEKEQELESKKDSETRVQDFASIGKYVDVQDGESYGARWCVARIVKVQYCEENKTPVSVGCCV